jgi:hypothetical protein
MTPEERERYEVRQSLARRLGRRKPRRPEASSRPGEVPRLHRKPSPLKIKIEFVYDPRDKSVVIGPEASAETKGDATEALEHGGISLNRRTRRRNRIAARPFMEPAFRKELPNLARWRGAMK